MGIIQRVWMLSTRNQPREMGHIDHEIGPHAVGNVPEAFEINLTRIGRAPRDDQFGLMFLRQTFHLIEIDQVVVFTHVILNGIEPFPGLVRGRPMGQMPTRGQRQAHISIARL